MGAVFFVVRIRFLAVLEIIFCTFAVQKITLR